MENNQYKKYIKLKKSLSKEQISEINFNQLDVIASKKSKITLIILLFIIFSPITIPCYIFLFLHKIFEFLLVFISKIPFLNFDYWRFFFLNKMLRNKLSRKNT